MPDHGTRLEVIQNQHSLYKMTNGQNRDDIRDLFGITAQLECDFATGKIHVVGSGSYLKDHMRKNDLLRLNLQYKVMTVYKGLKPYALHENVGMRWVGKIGKIKKAAENKLATHIVVGIQYGATAVFVYEYDIAEMTDISELSAYLKINIKNLPIKVNFEGNITMNETEVFKRHRLKINFHGGECHGQADHVKK